MDQDAGPEVCGPQEDEAGEPSEECGVGELEQGADKSGRKRRVWMGEVELIEVVDMGDAKVERSQENNA